MAQNITFIGLGVMGYPMASHLAKAGHHVTVFNRTSQKSAQWISENPGQASATIPESVAEADIIITCLSDDHSLEMCYCGESGILENAKPQSVIVDHTTASANIARKLYRLAAEKHIGFIDGPVSGGQQGAENGTLTIMCGGDEDTYEKVATVLHAYAKSVRLMGGPGSGQLTKMVNQIAIAGLIQGLAEGIHFAQQAGLDVEAVIQVISKGAAQSWQMEHRYKTMINNQYDHGFAVDLMRKDLAICLAEARSNHSKLPVTALVDQFYAEVQDMGGNRWDTSSLLARLNALKKQ